MNNKDRRLVLELLLLAEQYSLDEIRQLNTELQKVPIDEKVNSLLNLIITLKSKTNRISRKKVHPKKRVAEFVALKKLKNTDPEKYSVLKPIAVALSNNEIVDELSVLRDLIDDLGGDRRKTKSRKDAVRILINLMSELSVEEIQRIRRSMDEVKKDSQLGVIADFIMGE